MSSIFCVCMCDYSVWISIIWYLICNILLWYHDYHLEFYLHPISLRMQEGNHSCERKMLKNFWGKQKIKRSGGSDCMIVYWGCMFVKTCMDLIDRNWNLENYYGISQISIDPRSSNKKKTKEKEKQRTSPRLWASITRQKRKKKQKLKELLS